MYRKGTLATCTCGSPTVCFVRTDGRTLGDTGVQVSEVELARGSVWGLVIELKKKKKTMGGCVLVWKVVFEGTTTGGRKSSLISEL